VAVSLSDNGDDIVIAVADDGPGIPAADRERVFGRFIRLDGARARDAGGAGLGLAIAKEIVESHGGWIAVADAQPGARFELHFSRGAPPPNRGRGQAPSTVGVGPGDGCLRGG
jgi:signal transduction histidine kinase